MSNSNKKHKENKIENDFKNLTLKRMLDMILTERERERERIVGLGSGRTTLPPQPKPFNETLNRLNNNIQKWSAILKDENVKLQKKLENKQVDTIENYRIKRLGVEKGEIRDWFSQKN